MKTFKNTAAQGDCLLRKVGKLPVGLIAKQGIIIALKSVAKLSFMPLSISSEAILRLREGSLSY